MIARHLSLRVFVVVVMLGCGLYVGGFAFYLLARMRGPAVAFGERTEAMVARLEETRDRSTTLDHTADRLALVPAGGAVARAALPGMRELIAAAGRRMPSDTPGDVPPRLHTAFQDLDKRLADLADVLTGVAALMETGRAAEAGRRLTVADSLQAELDDRLQAAAGVVGRAVIADQRGLLQLANVALRATLVWVALGALLAPLVIYLTRRRILRPLDELERGLTAVAEGDLTARVPQGAQDELGRLAALFNEMTRVLRDRAEEQGRFAAAGELLAGVAHEVNNPLMAIAAQAELQMGDPVATPAQREEMQQILRQARRASKLLRGLLRFVSAGERTVTRVNLNDVVRGALDLVSYRFGVDEIDVEGTLDAKLPSVEGDPIRLEQVLVNLFSNALDALRAVPAPRRLTVDTWSDDGVVHVGVQDSGAGIPAAFIDRLFKPFATTKGRRGTGLGLYISRQLVREAGGDLALTSRPGDGARLVITLPVAKVAAVEAPTVGVPAAGAPVGTLAGVRILLVDDESAVRHPMVRFLTRRGATVVEAANGEEALLRLEEQDADVIIADLRMPKLDGIGLYERLQRTRPTLAPRVLFLSGDISQLAEPGNTPVPRERVLVKPLELKELETRVVEFLRELGG